MNSLYTYFSKLAYGLVSILTCILHCLHRSENLSKSEALSSIA